MRITAKTTLAIALSITLLTFATYGILSFYLVQRFGELEIDAGYKNLERYDEAVSAEKERLYETAADYGGWDDAYDYVLDQNEEFIESNFIIENFVSLRLDVAIISDQDGKVIFARHVGIEDPEPEEETVPVELLQEIGKPQSIFRFTEPQQQRVGLFKTRHAVFIVAAAPIITSDKQGPVRGTMLMARHLSEDYVHSISERVKLPLSSYEVDFSSDAVSSFRHTVPGQNTKDDVAESSPTSLLGSVLFYDLLDQPVLIVRTELPRIYSQQAVDAVRFVVLLLSAYGAILILLLMLLMQRLVISRITDMASRVKLLASGGRTERLRLPGKDEVSSLSTNVMDAFDALEKSKQAIRDSEKKFAMLSAASQDGIFMSSAGRIIEVNETASKITGYSEEELKNMSIFDLVAPESLDSAKKHVAQPIARPYEINLLRKNGEEFPGMVSGNTVRYGNRKIRISSMRDMTEIKRAEADLRESENRFKTLSKATLEGVLILEGDRIKDANDTVMRITGYAREDLVGMPIIQLVAEPDRKKIIDHISQSIEASHEVVGLKKSGDTYPLYISGHTEYDGGSPIRIKVIRDITEQKKTEQALRDWNDKLRNEREKLDIILHSIADAVVVISREGKILLINNIASEMCGYSLFDTVGHDFRSLLVFKGQDGASDLNFIDTVLQDGITTNPTGKTVLLKRDGSALPVSESAAPIKDLEGNITGCVLVFRDATKEREIDRMKTEFVSIASHQLRSPLSGIKWLIELVLNDTGELKPEQREYLEQIDVSNERMIQLVEDLLDVSRIETGRKFTIEKKDFDVVPVISGLLQEMTNLSLQKHVTTSTASDFPQSILLNADQEKIREVFKNLVSNAIKYTSQEGHVTIDHTRSAEEVVFSVKDDGIGIPKDQQKKIFEKFFRASNVGRVEAEGTGLGLYIAKAIVEGHGGRIWFESQEGRGTTFSFSLPAAPEKLETKPKKVNKKRI
ncbi:MAG: PAS domain S-box protein [Patescibacteria group bacterium]|nr:PAS domain S-box protein [Patescibacteria group bacterium]